MSAAIAAGTGTVAFEAFTASETIGVGNSAGKDFTLSTSELGDITSAGAIRIGAPGQSGNIEIATLDLHLANAPITINSTGTVQLTDGGSGVALAAGGNVTINAGVITATSVTNAFAEITTNLGTQIARQIATAARADQSTHRIQIGQFSGGSTTGFGGNVSVNGGGAGGGVFLDGIGGLNFSAISNAGNVVNVTTEAGDINASGAISGTVITLSAAGGIGTSGAVPLNTSVSSSLTTAGAGRSGQYYRHAHRFDYAPADVYDRCRFIANGDRDEDDRADDRRECGGRCQRRCDYPRGHIGRGESVVCRVAGDFGGSDSVACREAGWNCVGVGGRFYECAGAEKRRGQADII